MLKRRYAGEKNMHRVGEEGLELHVNLVTSSISAEQAEQLCVSLQEQCWVPILDTLHKVL